MRDAKLIALLTLVALTGSMEAKAADAGSIVSWGAIAFDSKELDANDFTAISAGSGHTLALKSDGSIVSWGNNDLLQAKPPAGIDFITVGAGGYTFHGTRITYTYHNGVASRKDGSIVGWGANGSGQATPPEGNNFIAIAAGHHHCLAIRKEPCPYQLVGGLNDDCRVDGLDYAVMVENWLIDRKLNPENPACIPK
jgi:hypothetical protein